MANIGKLLKDEFVRLSKKNATQFSKPLKTEIRSLKKQVRVLQNGLKTVHAMLSKTTTPVAHEPAAASQEAARGFSGKGIKALRRKFKITQAQLATLANVSSQSVVLWERKPGKIRLRHATLDALSAIRALSKAEVKAALGQKTPTTRKPSPTR